MFSGVAFAKLMSDGFCAETEQNHFYLMRSLFCLNLNGSDEKVEEVGVGVGVGVGVCAHMCVFVCVHICVCVSLHLSVPQW